MALTYTGDFSAPASDPLVTSPISYELPEVEYYQQATGVGIELTTSQILAPEKGRGEIHPIGVEYPPILAPGRFVEALAPTPPFKPRASYLARRVRARAVAPEVRRALLEYLEEKEEAKTVEQYHEHRLKALLNDLLIAYDFETELLGRISGHNIPFLLQEQIGITCFSDESRFREQQFLAKALHIRLININPHTLEQEGIAGFLKQELLRLDREGIVT